MGGTQLAQSPAMLGPRRLLQLEIPPAGQRLTEFQTSVKPVGRCNGEVKVLNEFLTRSDRSVASRCLGAPRLLLMLAVGMVFLPLTASLAASFDGTWDVVVICPAEPDGAKAFTLRYKAEVKNGVMHGQYGIKDQPGSQSMDGPIEPDGTAMLTASGLVGNPEVAYKQKRENHPYIYKVSARFEGNKGTGTRQKDRSCTFSFARKS
jgi:hypothetical protein